MNELLRYSSLSLIIPLLPSIAAVALMFKIEEPYTLDI